MPTPDGKLIVTVYGSSRPKPGSPDYEQAREMGRLLAEAGYVVATGGYVGTMAGTSQGAAEAGGHVIGVTASVFDSKGEGREGANQWVHEEIKFSTLSERLLHLVRFCDASITLPGGVGTLSELALNWSLMQVGEMPVKPLVLVGADWESLLTQFYNTGDYISEESMLLWRWFKTPREAVIFIDDAFGK